MILREPPVIPSLWDLYYWLLEFRNSAISEFALCLQSGENIDLDGFDIFDAGIIYGIDTGVFIDLSHDGRLIFQADGSGSPFSTPDIDFTGSVFFDDNIGLDTTKGLFFRDAAISISSADDGHLDLTADVSVDINNNLVVAGTADIEGNVAIGPNAGLTYPLHIQNDAVSTTISYYGIQNMFTKTAGATNWQDNIHGINSHVTINHVAQSHAACRAWYGYILLTAGTTGDATHPDNLDGLWIRSNIGVNGIVYGNQRGAFVSAYSTAGVVAGDIRTLELEMTVAAVVAGSKYMLYLNETSTPTYSIYQNGTAPSYFGGNLQTNQTAISNAVTTYSLNAVCSEEEVMCVDEEMVFV